jgi:hypothetical protein
MGTLKTDNITARTGNAINLGVSGDTITIPTGASIVVTDGISAGSLPAATLTTSGIVERSTSAENVTGSSDTVYPTVLGAKEIVDTHGIQLGAINTWTLPQRTALVVDNDGSFDQALGNNFQSTPAATYALTFTNHANGQSGYILLINTGGHVISLAATTKGSATVAATISTAGTYLVSYLSNGTNTYITSSVVYA